MRYHLLACDYDGTLAHDGSVEPETLAALEKLAASGRKLALVSGRELKDLLAVFPGAGVFDWIVAENGGVIYQPSTREEVALGPEPPDALVRALVARNVTPLSVGRVLLATWEPHERQVLDAIHELGLELQVIFNKGAVMVLPSGINKHTGLEAALDKLGLSVHNSVGIGDAENDHALLSACECGVAVQNALPALKKTADWVTFGSHGAGVRELIERILNDDLRSLESALERHRIPIGSNDEGGETSLAAFGSVVLIAGSSGSGKSTAAAGVLERISERGYQVCVIDPEGDHDAFEGAMLVGSAEQAPELEQALKILAKPESEVVVNLLAVPIAERPQYFLTLFTRLEEMRAKNGRPHWVVLDEAHHMLDGVFEPMVQALKRDLSSMIFITVNPDRLNDSLLERVNLSLFVGPEAATTLATFASKLGRPCPRVPPESSQSAQVLVWEPGRAAAMRVSISGARSTQRRHRRKYARGELGPDKSFYFRGAEAKLNLRAQNLVVFNDIGAGVDDDTWCFHLRNGDYSNWVREAIKDEELAGRISEVEQSQISAEQSRAQIRALIEQRYTAPA